MTYTIKEVKHYSTETYGRDSNHRVVIRFEGEEKDYSAFVSEKPEVGDTWDGELKKVEKNDKIYWNFEFAKNNNGTDKPKSTPEMPSNDRLSNVLSLHLVPVLERIATALEGKEIDENDF